MTQDNAFSLLSPELQRWAFRQGWTDLNSVQKAALLPVLEGKSDVIISASTAGGKTEAAFLPALTAVKKGKNIKGVSILCVSPLKALINDQYRRLDLITQDLNIPVTPWHGDISSGFKDKVLKCPSGIILTTPESLESMLINRKNWLQEALHNLKYIIIDEFHAFMGTPRGYQLQSQLHRIDNLCGRLIPRIALSATFSDQNSVSSHLRPRGGLPCKIVCGESNDKDSLALQLRGYELTTPDLGKPNVLIYPQANDSTDLVNDLFRLMRGKVNLVFCNSRTTTDTLAFDLKELSEKNFVPNEFFPHHGSLSKNMRESLEHRLIEGRLPTTAVCTATLELGIDISDVNSIAQIEAPLSVASMRQRLGRSGRRDHKAVLRLFIPEFEYHPLFNFGLCEEIFLSAAMVNLLLKRWYEPPMEHEYAFSTMIQQTLSVIASFGSVSAKQLYELLCHTGPFLLCDMKTFAQFLRDLGAADLITQLNDGSLALGLKGESLVSDYKFYTAFSNPVEYTIENDGRKIGTAPLTRSFSEGETFTFAGQSWIVVFFRTNNRVIGVKKFPEKSLPLLMNGNIGTVHSEVYNEMRRLYVDEDMPSYLNNTAKRFFLKGCKTFKSYQLDRRIVINAPAGLEIYPFRSDKVLLTMKLMLMKRGIKCEHLNSHLHLKFTSKDTLAQAVAEIVKQDEVDRIKLVSGIGNLDQEKYDQYLSIGLKRQSYAYCALDIAGAMDCFKEIAKQIL